MADLSLKDFLAQLAEERGLELRGYKHTTLDRRIRRRLAQLKIGGLQQYLDFVARNPDEINDLLNTVLINVTEFFRDPQAWEILRENILPRITRDLRHGDSLRIWSAGCASGEEAYSVAIAIAEHFGPEIEDYEIKIYATDIDDDALNTARRAEYPASLLRRVPRELRKKYFTGDKILRLARGVRRLVIFGKGNLASDAPISHVRLLICRNVLIYFDSAPQESIMKRLHYALDPGGILFLGKSESQIRSASLFRPLDSKWRFFERVGPAHGKKEIKMDEKGTKMAEQPEHNEEPALLKLYYNSLLQALEPGVVVLDSGDVIRVENPSTLNRLRLTGKKLVGKHLAESELAARCPELAAKIESTRPSNAGVRFECNFPNDQKVAVTIRPIMAEDGKRRAGTLICMEDVTPKERLQSTINALESTSEELQSANEELETTNEELQSTNEELETTNEELQSTNEELETTNEELQSLNEELETTNEEMELRGKELDASNERYAETLENLPWPMMLMDRDQNIVVWNAAARKLFGFGSSSMAGLNLSRLPIPKETTNAILRRYRSVLIKAKAVVAKGIALRGTRAREYMNIHFKPISKDNFGSVLVMFAPASANPGSSSKGPALKSNPDKKSKASKNGTRRTKKRK